MCAMRVCTRTGGGESESSSHTATGHSHIFTHTISLLLLLPGALLHRLVLNRSLMLFAFAMGPCVHCTYACIQ